MPESSADGPATRTRLRRASLRLWSRRFRVQAHVARTEARRSWDSVATAADALWQHVVDWFNAREFSENAILIGFAFVIGVGAALGVVGFYKFIDVAYVVFFRYPGTFLSHSE